MIIELTGPVGAGKSTIANLIQNFLQEQGVPVFLAASKTELMVLRRMGLSLPLGIVNRWYGLRFLFEYSPLAWTVFSAQWGRPVPWQHRAWVLKWFLTHIGRHYFLSRHLKPGEVLIFPEGLIHRVVSLFTSEKELPSTKTMARYVQHLPRSDLLIDIKVSPVLCVERLMRRGMFRRRLQNLGADATLQFVRYQAEAIAQAISEAQRCGWALLTLDNSGPVVQVQEQLQTHDIVGKFMNNPTKPPQSKFQAG